MSHEGQEGLPPQGCLSLSLSFLGMQHQSHPAAEACRKRPGKGVKKDPLSAEKKPPPRVTADAASEPFAIHRLGRFGAPAGRAERRRPDEAAFFSSGGCHSDPRSRAVEGGGETTHSGRVGRAPSRSFPVAVPAFPPPLLLLPPPSPPPLRPPRSRRLSSRRAVRRFLTHRRHLGPRALRSRPPSGGEEGGGAEGRRRACAEGLASFATFDACPRDRREARVALALLVAGRTRPT